MATIGEKSCLDIEAGPHSASAAGESDGSLCFSDADDASWHSPHDSNRNASPSEELLQRSGASNDEIDGVGEPGRSPCCISESSFEVDLEKNEADCRICHLNLESKELGIPIVLGCSCRNDLAAAHKQCAETWFKVKGNKTCEICGSTAKNVGNPEHLNEAYSHIVASARPNETCRFWRGHRFLNLLLACLIFAFVVSWLFRFNT
ncbi:uncharacterized protein A4U43_C07F940 [Asparagus officinalis]|uniref:RING-CH-type domain-containing protein n=1 Tax=Asparagus officinalis TaxID=4686 RepID=A0A5P1E8U0_ASPOF|nr:uncharacterized protein LOC109848265 [Asparagus officinalis]ONK62153.1 uncharacterized protein A4U43_C07F940 [Asparagus officinalis]